MRSKAACITPFWDQAGGGKTTLLRLIGGFIRPSSGKVLLHGQDVSELPPNRRPTSMVFQSFALFPHMTVERNVAYGLKLRKIPQGEVRDRVNAMLDMVGLGGYNRRMPHELSGGQQQRVQLARSLVLERDILLLDEPLASLDARLRKDMCLELKRLQEKVGITFIHVTHNQEEALTVADRIAIIADGLLVEEGRPQEIYEKPRRRFTAEFMGENNVFSGVVSKIDGNSVTVDLGIGSLDLTTPDHAGLAEGSAAAVSIRSELATLVSGNRPDNGSWQFLPATYIDTVYLGLTISHMVRLDDGSEIVVRTMSNEPDGQDLETGQPVTIGVPSGHLRLHPD